MSKHDIDIVRITPEHLTTDAAVAPAAAMLRGLVAAGAAIGWVDPPSIGEVADLLRAVAAEGHRGDASLVFACRGGDLAGLGYWRRYARPTHSPHADIEKVAVHPHCQGAGVGRKLMAELLASARDNAVEVLTLDVREDNTRAIALYESLGFSLYGRLERFVAVGAARYGKRFYAIDLRPGAVGSRPETVGS